MINTKNIIGCVLVSFFVLSVALAKPTQEEQKPPFFSLKGVWAWLLRPEPTPQLKPQSELMPKGEDNTQNLDQQGVVFSPKKMTQPKRDKGKKSLATESLNNASPTESSQSKETIDEHEKKHPKDSSGDSLAGKTNRPEENKKLLERIKKHQEEVSTLCEEIGGLLSSVSVSGCLSHNFSHGEAYSVKGRALVYKDVLPKGVSPEQAVKLSKVLVIGGIHGDEYSSFSIIFRWLEKLTGNEEAIQQYWRFIPAANPDGLLSFKPAQRMNANGVDLNRNFLTNDWQDKAKEYWEQKTGKDARRNPGQSAASEPETLWLSDLIAQWKPDVIVSVHAPYGILDFDSTEKRNIQAPDKIGMLHLKLLGTYPGSLGRYAALNRGIPVLTMELPHAGIMPSKKEQNHLWQDLKKWLNENI